MTKTDFSGLDGAAPSMMFDLRPCFEGFAGIPQESRLLFSMFSQMRLRRFAGLVSGITYTSRRKAPETPYDEIFSQTQLLISQDTRRVHWMRGFNALPVRMRQQIQRFYISLTEGGRREKLDMKIDPEIFADYLWMKMFDRTLPSRERALLERAEFSCRNWDMNTPNPWRCCRGPFNGGSRAGTGICFSLRHRRRTGWRRIPR
jgi:hypothetical protein